MNATDRVRAHTADKINSEIDRQIQAKIWAYANRSEADITCRIEELDREWDIERLLETNASVAALTGLVLGLTYNRKWLIVPGTVLTFLLQHALQGWCQPLPILRRLGIRTREEIDREKYALKVLRGDFDQPPLGTRAATALRAVEA